MTTTSFLRPAYVGLVVTMISLALGPAAGAHELGLPRTSLALVPEDAAFYRAWLHGRDQLEAIGRSRAWAKLRALPAPQAVGRWVASPEARLAWQIGTSQLPEADRAIGQARSVWNDPQVQRLLGLLGDMFEREVFVYGESGFVDLASLVDEVARETLYEPTLARALGRASAVGLSAYRDRFVAALARRADRLRIPNVVVGFKVRNVPQALEHVGKLELALGGLCWSLPALGGRMGRTQVGEATFITLTLHGSALSQGTKPGPTGQGEAATHVQTLDRALREARLVVAFGVRDDYLLFSIGSSLEALAALGQGKPLLDRSELAPLRRMRGGRLTSISYRSQALRTALPALPAHVAALEAAFAEHAAALGLDAVTEARLRHDAAELARDLAAGLRRPGAVVQASLWSDVGIECFTFDYSEHPWRDGYRPFGLAEHLGGSPLLAVSYRSTWTARRHDAWVGWLDRAYGYFDDHGLWQLDPPWRARCRATAALVRAAGRQLNTLLRDVVLPTLADGQIALVVNVERSARGGDSRLCPALVVDPTAARRLREAYWQSWRLYQELADAGADVPPSRRRPAPPVTPRAGQWVLSDRVWVLASTPRQAARLLAPTPLDVPIVSGGPERGRATIAYVDWAQLVELAKPAVRDATRRVVRRFEGGADAARLHRHEAMALEHVDAVLECLQVLRSVTREVYVEDGAVVTHTVWALGDVE